MYAFISGELADPGPPTVVEVAGVGYELWIPERERLRLPAVGSPVKVYTHLQVREDDQTLYGFLRASDREIFRSLIGVTGVGPKVALAILGQEGADGVLRAIGQGDPTPLVTVKGIGRKTAERLVVELKDRAQRWFVGEAVRAAAAGGPADDDATQALIGMGIAPERARLALSRIDAASRGELSVEELVRRALRYAV